MSLLDRLRHIGESQRRDENNEFKPTPEELSIIHQFLPEGRGGFRAFVTQLGEEGIPEERHPDLIDIYRTRKHEVMGKGEGKERQA